MTNQSQQIGSLLPPSVSSEASALTSKVDNSTQLINASNNVKKPFEMNTYIQLEMDSNNCNCVPRVCKFCITKLSLQTDLESVILAVKLQVSKRSLRTVEIPILKNLSSTSLPSKQSSADLNLNYNITYPHFLKKDSNILYFYIQRRKKYKSRTILGYKTLAYTYIDLASVLQRPFSKDLPLIINKNLNKLSELRHSKKTLNYNQIIGTLRIESLVSQPIEMIDPAVEQTPTNNYFRTDQSKMTDLEEDIDDLEYINEFESNHHKLMNKEIGSDSENELVTESSTNRLIINNSNKKDDRANASKLPTSSNSKNITGKIISFIRKLRNDNDENEHEEETEEITEDLGCGTVNFQNDTILNADLEEEDFDVYDIEQISDYDTDTDDQDQDAYSIVSTPKPKLEPYFSNSNIDLVFKNDNKSIDKKSLSLKNERKDSIVTNEQNNADSKNVNRRLSTRKSHNNSFKMTNNNLIEKIETKLNILSDNSSNYDNNGLSFILIDDSDHLLQILATISNRQDFVLITSLYEIKIMFETILKWFQNQIIAQNQTSSLKQQILINLINHIKLIIIGNDQFFNKYAQVYVEFLKLNESLIQFLPHYFIPRNNTSILATYMCKLSQIYNNLFGDEFWAKLDTDMILKEDSCYNDVESRLIKYVNLSSNDYSIFPLQIGEIMLNQQSDETNAQVLPFLFDIRIGFPTKPQSQNLPEQQINDQIDNIIDLTKQNQISKSNSLTHFNNNINNTNNNVLMQSSSQHNSPSVVKTSEKLFQYTNSNSSGSSNIMNNIRPNSPPNSPLSSDEFGYNLQLDYWTINTSNTLTSTFSTPTMLSNINASINKSNSTNNSSDLITTSSNNSNQNTNNKTSKSSTKALFKSLHIYRGQLIKTTLNNTNLQSSTAFNSNILSCISNNTSYNCNDSQNLTIIYVIKEKKQKIMRLSKKSKESDNKRESVEGLTRLVCTSRYHNIPLNVFIDDLEYNDIKFLQISSLWQGKVKFINIMIP